MTKTTVLSIFLLLVNITFALSQSGTLDTSFSEDGIAIQDLGTNSFDLVYGSALQKDGKIVVVGASAGNFIAIRYLPEGNPDSTFGNSGIVIADYNGLDDRCHAVTIQPDGKIILAGETRIAGQQDFAVLRLQPDGRPDSSFGVNGWATTDLGTTYEFPNCVTLQRDGRILTAGRKENGFHSDFAMVRYQTNGQLDTLFGEHGIVTTNLREEDEAFSIAVQPDNLIVLAGFASISAMGDFAVVRYNPDGTPDKLFGDGGKVLTDMDGVGASDFIRSMVLMPNGKILVAGNANNNNIDFSSDAGMARYDKHGDLDPTFGIGGKYIIPFGSKTDINSVALQADGKILLGGNSDVMGDNRWLLARFLPDAGLDTTFGDMGIITTDFPDTREFVDNVLVQTDGRIILAGTEGTSTNLDFAVARYIADFAITYSVQGSICYGTNDGTITVNAEGGVAPYEYSITGGASYQAANTFTDLAPGSYIITLRDANGQVGVMGPVEVKNRPAPPEVTVVSDADSDMIEIIVDGTSDGFQYSNDGGTTFQAESIFTNLDDGTYLVVVVDQNGCVLHTEQILISTLGIASLNVLAFDLSPNPGDGLLTIELADVASVIDVQVADMAGRIVYTSQVDGNLNGKKKLDLRFLPEGNYFLRINDGEKWGVRKVVVLR